MKADDIDDYRIAIGESNFVEEAAEVRGVMLLSSGQVNDVVPSEATTESVMGS